MQAVRNGHLSIVLYLLSKGADPNHMTTFGTSVMSLAVRSGSLQVVKALKNNGYVPAKVNEISPELASVSSSRDDLLTELLSKPGNIDICMHNSLQLTPLMIAARNNDLNSVRTILQNSTQLVKQLETTDASGRRASENARSYGNTEMRNYLERKTKKYSEKFCGQNADRINPNTLINAIKSSKDELNWKSFNGNVGYDGILGLSPVDKLVNTNYNMNKSSILNLCLAQLAAPHCGHIFKLTP